MENVISNSPWVVGGTHKPNQIWLSKAMISFFKKKVRKRKKIGGFLKLLIIFSEIKLDVVAQRDTSA